ncbi:hypothetical protein N800_06695 [Lysobacter daejeonensis GH1-9]|uniref:Uncharacterized protein n=1 Tax=Lysobacter daejeonensis GH1-9 TaxID=1385517 RepID=A0A0A0EX51_9GAMM|nr:hypothetical protein [Lysobacter daejeonensis]KGM54663.1 hypothetical protein N800_06695 [Lysobacter daejeonensis GH1-9]
MRDGLQAHLRRAFQIDGIELGDRSWRAGIDEAARRFPVHASGGLQAFRVIEGAPWGKGDDGEPLRTYHLRATGSDKSLELIAIKAWQMLSGTVSREQGEHAIARARIEFARSQLHQTLLAVADAADGEAFQLLPSDDLLSMVATMDWSDGDQLARDPMRLRLPFHDAAKSFVNWCDRFGPAGLMCDFDEDVDLSLSQDGLEPAELMAGMALVLLDAAAVNAAEPRLSREILGAAMEVMRIAGLHLGWVMSNEAGRRASSESGKRGASSRHEASRRLKQWALEEAQGMQGAPREIARQLERRLPEHLVDVSADPQRLIYEALLHEQKSRKAPKR